MLSRIKREYFRKGQFPSKTSISQVTKYMKQTDKLHVNRHESAVIFGEFSIILSEKDSSSRQNQTQVNVMLSTNRLTHPIKEVYTSSTWSKKSSRLLKHQKRLKNINKMQILQCPFQFIMKSTGKRQDLKTLGECSKYVRRIHGQN